MSSANFYAFDQHTMSKDAATISAINQQCVLWMGTLTPVRGPGRGDGFADASGRKFLPEEATRIYHPGIAQSADHSYRIPHHRVFEPPPHRESGSILLELEKKDTVVMAGVSTKSRPCFERIARSFFTCPTPC